MKQVIVIRNDLNMRKGKMVAQGAHASLDELESVYRAACDAGMNACIITDAGHTEFGGVPTRTAVAIGPDDDERIDVITSHLKLL